MMKTIIESLLKIKKKIQFTQAPITVTLLRAVIGWIFVKEGAGKLFGWFGGAGLEAVFSYFKDLGIPLAKFSALLVGYSELLCGIAFIAGLFTRVAALIVAIIMLVAIFVAHRDGAFNYPLVLLMACVLFLQVGAGLFSIDRKMQSK